MSWKLFLDDERFPTDLYNDPFEWRIARGYQDAKWMVETYGMPSFISFDHDLGSNTWSGMDFCKWLCHFMTANEIDPTTFEFYVHSMNPVGAENIRSYLNNFVRVHKEYS